MHFKILCLVRQGSGLHLRSTLLSGRCLQMAFMLMERNSGNSTIDYPLEGSQGIVDALVRGIEKNGGRVLLRARVEDILIEGEALCSSSLTFTQLFSQDITLGGLESGKGDCYLCAVQLISASVEVSDSH